MALKKNYTKFTDILDDITDVPDTLDVTVHGIKVADTVADASLLTTKGNLTGTFSGKATNEAGKSQMYDFKWTAVQTAGGKDAAQDAVMILLSDTRSKRQIRPCWQWKRQFPEIY